MTQLVDDFAGQVHPDASPVVGDMREDVVRHIDGVPDPSVDDLADERAAQTVNYVLSEALRGVDLTRKNLSRIGQRALTALWVVNPTLVGGGDAISLSELARRLGCTTPNLSVFAADISRRLGVANIFQHSHDSASGRHPHLDPRDEPDESGEMETEGDDG